MFFHGFWLVFTVFKGIFMVVHWSNLPSSTMRFFAKPSVRTDVVELYGPTYAIISDGANHWSSDALFAMYRSSIYLDISQDSIWVHSDIISIFFSKFNYSYSSQKEKNLFQIYWRFSKWHFNRKWIYCDSFQQEVNFIQLIDNWFILIFFLRK